MWNHFIQHVFIVLSISVFAKQGVALNINLLKLKINLESIIRPSEIVLL